MPLKPSYATEADVPTERKADYVLKGGRYVLDVEGFDNIDGVLAKNSELVGKVNGHAGELQAKQAEVDRLNGELTNARNSSVPHGKRAVPVADAELAEAVKAAGVTTADAFKTLHAEHGEFKTKALEADTAKHAAAVAEAMGWDKDKTSRLVPKHFDLSTVELRDGEGGKKQPVAKVKQADGTTFVEKPFADVVKTTPELTDLVPLLTSKTGPVIGTQLAPEGEQGDGDFVEKHNKARDAARAQSPNPLVPRPVQQQQQGA